MNLLVLVARKNHQRAATGHTHRLDIGMQHHALGFVPRTEKNTDGTGHVAIKSGELVLPADRVTQLQRLGHGTQDKTVKKFIAENVSEHLIHIGNLIQKGWKEAADKAGLEIRVAGLPPLSEFSFQYDNKLALNTLFTQLMLEKGFLAWAQFKSSFAHKEEHVEKYLTAVSEVFKVIKQAIDQKQVEKKIDGRIAKSGFYRLTG